MAATLLLSRFKDKVTLPNGEPLASQYPLGKGTLRLSYLPDQTPVIAWVDKNEKEHYRLALRENGDYFVSPAEAYRSYSEDELAEHAKQAAVQRAQGEIERKRQQLLLNRGKGAFNAVAARRRVITLPQGRQFFDEETSYKFWYTDGDIASTPLVDKTDIVISGATWAYCITHTGRIEVVVLWPEPTDDFFVQLGLCVASIAAQNT